MERTGVDGREAADSPGGRQRMSKEFWAIVSVGVGLGGLFIALGTFMVISLGNIDSRFDSMETHFNARFDSMDSRFNSMDSRFNSMEGRFNSMETNFNTRLDSTNARLDSIQAELSIISQRVSYIEGHLGMQRRIPEFEGGP